MALKIYKASAGTGKTYRLTLAYLSLVLGNKNRFDVQSFNRILAVTFTNKATREMKTRILDNLERLARGEDTAMSEALSEETGLERKELIRRAAKVYPFILHNYSRFSITTLDAFFYRVLQSFLLESGFSRGYTVDTDTEYLLERTARRIIARIPDDEHLLSWFKEIIYERLTRSGRWNTARMLKQTGRQAMRESFRGMGESFAGLLSDRNFLKAYMQTYRVVIEGFENSMSVLGQRALDVLEENGFSTFDFPYKNTSFAGYFKKITHPHLPVDAYIPGTRVLEAAEGKESLWFNKSTPEGLLALQPVLLPVLREILECYKTDYRAYATAVAIKEQIPQMGLLADIMTTARQIQEEQGTLDIGDATYLLNRLVGDGNVPFVYEKTGSRYDSFLLDEFQDTSVLQWQNMHPLVRNGLSEGYDSLIVGDVKQSIYRWRNSDWRILGESLEKDAMLAPLGLEAASLHTNFRSAPQIIHFVNELTEGVCQSLTGQLKAKLAQDTFLEQNDRAYMGNLLRAAYKNHEIRGPVKEAGDGDEEGFVQIDALYASDKEEAEEKVLSKLQELLHALLDRGYTPSDILILVRSRTDARTVSRFFLQHGDIPLLTEDSLYTAASPYVNLSIALFTLALFPQDSTTAETVSVLAGAMGKRDSALDPDFLAKLRLLPLPDAFEAVLRHMEWSRATTAFPYLQDLHDCIFDFFTQQGGSTYAFLKWWHERGKEKMLSTDVPHEAIRMMTIHKAKGLEAPVVVIPFCDWALDPRKGENIIWAHAVTSPFDILPLLPVQYNDKLQHTYFAKDYYLEYSQRLLDALNLLYVAITRPQQELYMFLPFTEKNAMDFISGPIREALSVMEPSADWKKDFVWRSCGGIPGEEKKIVKKAARPEEADSYTLWSYESGDFYKTLQLQPDDGFNYAPDDSMRQWGIVLHKALALIYTREDIPAALEALVQEGELSGNPQHIKKMVRVIEEKLNQPEIAEWYDGSWKVRNEPTILG
ncbi:MAG: UvrD-helicase domain-containing protein, partial [Bacteroidales bacterium]